MDALLKSRLREGRVSLFLGAGASTGCKNLLGEEPPLSRRLMQVLADAMKLPLDKTETLRSVTTAARRRLGADFDEILRKNYTIAQPSGEYRALSQYAWPRIYTLNIDDGLEGALRGGQVDSRVFHYKQPLFDIGRSTASINLVKLNGSVDRLYEGIIFSEEEYASALNKVSWYETVIADYLSGATFVFIGTMLDEPLFSYHLSRLTTATERAPARGYLIVPELSEITADNFRDKNITPVLGTLSDFVSFVRESLGRSYTTTDIAQERLPSFVGVLRNLGLRHAEPIISGLYDIIPVSRDTLLQSSPSLGGGLRDFYFGNAPTWRDIFDHVHAELDCYTDVQAALRATSRLIIVHGSAGCGKSTCILDACLAHSRQPGAPQTYFLKPSRDLPISAIRFLAANIDKDLLFVVDNFTQYWRSLKEICEDNTCPNVRFLVADRTNAWSRVSTEFESVAKSVVHMKWITRSDATRILKKLESFGDWSRMEKLSEERRIQEIYENPKKQLLVALKEATTGRGFDEIINSEYGSLVGDYERASCIYAALATMHNLRLSVQTFDTLMRRRFGMVRIPRDTNLEGIVAEESGGLSLRHRVIADHLIRRVVSRDDIADAIGDVMQAQARLGAPLRETAKAIEYRLFTRLTNHQFLLELFRRNPERMVSKFDENQANYRADFLFWLQLALFEFYSKKELRQRALDHIGIARNIYSGSFQVTNAYCQMRLEMAMDVRSESEALLMMEEASEALEGEMKDPRTEPYALTVLAFGRVKVFGKWFPNEVQAEARKMAARLRDAERRYPGDAELKETRNQVALLAVSTDSGRKAMPRTHREPYGRRRHGFEDGVA